ncbi:MAG: SH3 domain-containing protein [Myxococcota bacterium]
MRGITGLLLGLLATLPVEAPAETPLLEQAVATYAQALATEERSERLAAFRSAERMFAKLALEGYESADLYVNTGNAALQAERLGAAVLAYRRALREDPDHPRALRNLEYARGLLPEWLPRPEPAGTLDSFFFWRVSLTRAERGLAAALCFFLACLLASAGIRFGLGPLRNTALLPGLAWLALALSLLFDPAADASKEGVVSAEEVTLRVADSHLSAPALPYPLPAGAEVQVLERRPPWLRVRLASGRSAWLAMDSVTTLASPDLASGS